MAPYYKAPYYKHNMVLEDFQEMAKILDKIKGKFILSINEHPDMREVFKAFKFRQASLKYSVSKGPLKDAKELLINNF